MSLKHYTLDSKLFSSSKHCRLDEKYSRFTQIQQWKVFESALEQVKLSDLLIELPITKQSKGELEEEAYLVNISDQQQRSGEMENIEKTNEIGSDKTYLGDADIFVSKLGMPKGYIFVNTFKGENILGSSEFIPYKLRNSRHLKYLKYLLLHPKLLAAYSMLESGKTPSHKRVNPYEFLNIKVPLVPKDILKQIEVKARPIENKINSLKKRIKPAQEIVNEVFAREFNLDLEKFEKLRAEKFFDVNLDEVSKNNLARVSPHFHHRKLDVIEEKIRDVNVWIPIKSVFKLSGGKRIPKGNTFSTDETNYFYLRPTEVSIWGIDRNSLLYISKDIHNQLKRYKITTGEFCISIVGTLGKTALVNTEELEIEKDNIILSENFVKLAPIKKINHLFYFYYFYSFIFEAQAEREYTITSMKKLGIDKWNYIKIPDISLPQQQKIVNEIKARLDSQEEIKKRIEEERRKIDEILENAIK